jgi:hypothetical protein
LKHCLPASSASLSQILLISIFEIRHLYTLFRSILFFIRIFKVLSLVFCIFLPFFKFPLPFIRLFYDFSLHLVLKYHYFLVFFNFLWICHLHCLDYSSLHHLIRFNRRPSCCLIFFLVYFIPLWIIFGVFLSIIRNCLYFSVEGFISICF